MLRWAQGTFTDTEEEEASKGQNSERNHTRNCEAVIFGHVINEWPQSKAEQTITGQVSLQGYFWGNIVVASTLT